ncbi:MULTISPECIES: 4a-hydroxytetrahydrobiopterin dehydratase [unclassified Hydrogenophaga]|jgi:4a-hydroxytetrahydrobiopterin dehydratase|uniref:4a-hydroxytetrahydrobiopterin dehydratase n=1 Tax=unclassified Hydrogenophaga TaxID=2610897 RepID=UPI0008791E11|nr:MULTISPECIES: 4a-hydroxytetrahydrobiopterin dehydratase [unclassified Hydrogenophaga]MBN9370395.1 4a-hydroxytetrahydrobiopterin dehydratase [Hydrogenophaga sp.]OJV72659.1 MAG: pterin-4-alpha-carbinolamine dehydratase [Hydrogenophaga sp. 70-12]
MHPIHQNRRALNATEIVTQLSQLNGSEADGWKLIDGAIERTFRFANYHETMAFVNAMAWIAHREDHHPDAAFGYNRCTLRFNTHDVNGVSVSDFHCAAAVNALLAS